MWPRDKNLGMAVMFFDAGCFPLLLLPAGEEWEDGGISIRSFGGFNCIVRFPKGSHKDHEHGNAPPYSWRTFIGSKSRLLFKLIANDLILINGNMN